MDDRTALDCRLAGAAIAHRMLLVRTLADVLREAGRDRFVLDRLQDGVLADLDAMAAGAPDDVAAAVRRHAVEELIATTAALRDALSR